TVKAHMQQLTQIGERLRETPDGQVSLTDPDARSMATSGRGTGIVGYNVQTAVDTKHHLIVAYEVTNLGHDRTQLSSMAKQARSATGTEELTVVADRGYFNGPEILECDQAGMTPLVPKPLTFHSKAEVASTNATLFTSLKTMSTAAPRDNGPSSALPLSRTA